MSLRPSSSAAPSACSGDMYAGVPITTPAEVRCTSRPEAVSLAMPKSTTLTRSRCPFSSTRKTLSGLMSRWMILRWCAASSAHAHCNRIGPAIENGIRLPPASRAESGSPSSSSITQK